MRPSLFLWAGRRAEPASRRWAAQLDRRGRRAYSSSPEPAEALDVAALDQEMRARPAQVTPDILTTTQSRLLGQALGPFLPRPRFAAPRRPVAYLAPGDHFVHFPLALPAAALCRDGTDPYPSPGKPFRRRVWAGGALTFGPPFQAQGRAASCVERILGVTASGPPGAEKIFVTVGREYQMDTPPHRRAEPRSGRLTERRVLAFMRPLSPREAAESVAQPPRILKPPSYYRPPWFSHTLTPTPNLLSQYSALSYNAHAIHFNPEYCREIEGYRNMLVHGPLSLTLMLRVLDSQLPRNAIIHTFEYSHLAPLYVNEPMTIHVLPGREPGQWIVWIEGPGGGMCVKGHCTTMKPVGRQSAEGTVV